MMENIYVQIVFFLIIGCFFLVLSHAIMVRWKIRSGVVFSGQVLLVKCNLVINILLILSFLAFVVSDARFSSAIYLMLTYNAFFYMYFHFFNMSDTARRIKLLLMIYTNQIERPEDLNDKYNSNDMLTNRLERLEQMGQIRFENGAYQLNNYFLVMVALLISLWNKMLHIRKK